MVTRILTNLGEEFPTLAGGSISFLLVSLGGRNPVVYDTTTLENISADVIASIDANGMFSADLWPNDRGDITTFYYVTISHSSIRPQLYKIQVPSGVTDLLWSEAILLGDPTAPPDSDSSTIGNLEDFVTMILVSVPRNVWTVYGSPTVAGGSIPEDAMQESADALIAAGVPVANIAYSFTDLATLGGETITIGGQTVTIQGG